MSEKPDPRFGMKVTWVDFDENYYPRLNHCVRTKLVDIYGRDGICVEDVFGYADNWVVTLRKDGKMLKTEFRFNPAAKPPRHDVYISDMNELMVNWEYLKVIQKSYITNHNGGNLEYDCRLFIY